MFQPICAMSTNHKRLHILVTPEQMEWLKKKSNSFSSAASIVRNLINRAMKDDP